MDPYRDEEDEYEEGEEEVEDEDEEYEDEEYEEEEEATLAEQLMRRRATTTATAAVAGRAAPSRTAANIDSVGTKRPRPPPAASHRSDDDDDGGKAGGGGKGAKRSKHAPVEQSAKCPVEPVWEVLPGPKLQRRDPRFDVTSGHFDERLFGKAYKFVEEYREKEMAELKAAMKAAKRAEEREELRAALNQLQSKQAQAQKRHIVSTALAESKRAEAAAVAAGKKPFFPKRKAVRELAAQATFAALKARGGEAAVDKALKKRRAKLAAKERRKLPGAGGSGRGGALVGGAGRGGRSWEG